MHKLANGMISDSGGLIAAGESSISDVHWGKLKANEKNEKVLLAKLKITKDNRKKDKSCAEIS